MGKINFSIVITVLNEEKNIIPLLDTLINQSTPPIEIIVVDAGSSDDTKQLILHKAKATSIPIRLFHESGLNRSQGRNYGIDKASGEYIAVIDAGCEADKQWLEELGNGFDGDNEAVAGFYLPIIHMPIQQLFAAYVATSPEDFREDTFLPSSRSLAFSKHIWKEVGKYPEKLNTCEDLVFARNLKQTGKMTVRKQALVYWHQAEGIKQFYAQIRGYARGDIEAGFGPHVLTILSVWLRYVFFLAFPPLFLLYIFYPIAKHFTLVKHCHEGLALPLVQVTCDWGIMVGSLQGLLKRLGLVG